MSLSITTLRPATESEWDQVYSECPYATYFHSRPWAEIWQVYSAGQSTPVPQRIEFSDGMTALLPISQRRLPNVPISRIYSSHAGTFGGWLSTDPLTINHTRLLTHHLLHQPNELIWRLNPYDPLIAMSFPSPTDGSRSDTLQSDHTLTLSLAPGFDAILRGWSKGHRAAISQARRKGVAVSRAQNTDDWRAYFLCYEDSLRRWGDGASSRYSWSLFELLSRQPAERVQLWLARADNQVIAGALLLCSQSIAVYWHGAARTDYFPHRPVHLLIHDAVKHACDTGCRYFDFNPSGGHEGVEAFKHGFAPAALPAPLIRKIVQEFSGTIDPLSVGGAGVRTTEQAQAKPSERVAQNPPSATADL